MTFSHFSPVALSLLLTSVFLAPSASAQNIADVSDAPEPRRYAVEIILFRYGPGIPVGNEQFDPPAPLASDAFDDDAPTYADEIPEFGDTPMPLPENGLEPGESTEIEIPAVDVEFQVTPRSELTLQETYDKLELLDAYDPVMWGGWSQLAVAPDSSPEILLRRLGNPPVDFDGMLKLYLSRFLHLVVNVTLTERIAMPQDVVGNSVPQFRDVELGIEEDRIMKNGDLRYYDHPKFGLLAKVMRIEEEAPGDEFAGDPMPPAAR